MPVKCIFIAVRIAVMVSVERVKILKIAIRTARLFAATAFAAAKKIVITVHLIA